MNGDFIREWWSAGVALVGLIGWLIRMESRVNANSKELLRLERQIDRDRVDARVARSEANDLLKEVRSDIKMLLRDRSVAHHTDRTIPPGRP